MSRRMDQVSDGWSFCAKPRPFVIYPEQIGTYAALRGLRNSQWHNYFHHKLWNTAGAGGGKKQDAMALR